ncbi:MAG: DNA primase [Planctomycetota bacterium]
MSLGSDTKDQVKRATDIVDLIGGYHPLRRSGSNYVCHCPWHDDTRPSLQINPARQSWVCWVCDIRGDVFDFVMRKESVEFFDAMKILADRAGIPITMHQKKVVKGSPEDKQTLYAAMKWATERFQSFLMDADAASLARQYLTDRQFTAESISKFRIGFAPAKFSWLADEARNTEFSPEVLAACDLIAQSDRSHGYFERFRGRLIFPIFDVMGRPIAIGGRVVPGVEISNAQAKYVNSRETRLFSKSETLYGLNLAKDFVSKTRSLTVVEGYTDVIGASQAGLEDVVACLGTALNEKHIRLIKRFADRITLVLDGDEAGRRRANDVVDLFVANDVDLRIMTLPDGQDPMDFLQTSGRDAFQELVNRADDAIGHKIKVETSGIDLVTDTHRANAALDKILQTLARIPASLLGGSADKILRQEQLLTRLARQFGVEREQIKNRMLELRSSIRPQFAPQEESQPRIDFSKFLNREVELIQLLLHASEHLDTIIEQISPEQFVPGPLKELYEFIDQCFQNGDEIGFDSLMLLVEDASLKNVLVYLIDQWHEKKQAGNSLSITDGDLVAKTINVFRNLELDTGNRRKISELQQKKLNEEEELTTLEDLLNQARQRQGL